MKRDNEHPDANSSKRSRQDEDDLAAYRALGTVEELAELVRKYRGERRDAAE